MSTNDPTKGTIFDKGSWQHALNASGRLYDKSGTDRKKASILLWQAATSAIAEWAQDTSEDENAEGMYGEMIGILGEHRKGDVSKIKTVALAVANADLDTGKFTNLSRAYAEARRLTHTAKVEKAEDAIAEEVIEAIAESAPKSATSPTSAAMILLSKGIDGAVVAILDALNGAAGEHNPEAHRAFLRALTTEVSSRVAAKAQAEKEAAAAARAQEKAEAKAKAEAAKAKVGDGASKGKAKPASDKAKAASETLKEKAAAKDVTPNEPDPEHDDLDDLLDDVEPGEDEGTVAAPEAEANKVETPAVPAKKAAVRRPVRRQR